jgi:hypothetical protein
VQIFMQFIDLYFETALEDRMGSASHRMVAEQCPTQKILAKHRQHHRFHSSVPSSRAMKPARFQRKIAFEVRDRSQPHNFPSAAIDAISTRPACADRPRPRPR